MQYNDIYCNRNLALL